MASSLQERYPVGESDNRRGASRSLSQAGDPLIQSSPDHQEESSVLEITELPRCDVEGGGRSTSREEDFHPHRISCQELHQIPYGIDGSHHHRLIVFRGVLFYAPTPRKESEEKEGLSLPESISEHSPYRFLEVPLGRHNPALPAHRKPYVRAFGTQEANLLGRGLGTSFTCADAP